MVNGYLLPGPWQTHGRPIVPPAPEYFGNPGEPPTGPEPMATGQDSRGSPSSISYLTPTPSSPGLGDSISSGAGSPAMPDTPTGAQLPKVVAEGEFSRYAPSI